MDIMSFMCYVRWLKSKPPEHMNYLIAMIHDCHAKTYQNDSWLANWSVGSISSIWCRRFGNLSSIQLQIQKTKLKADTISPKNLITTNCSCKHRSRRCACTQMRSWPICWTCRPDRFMSIKILVPWTDPQMWDTCHPSTWSKRTGRQTPCMVEGRWFDTQGSGALLASSLSEWSDVLSTNRTNVWRSKIVTLMDFIFPFSCVGVYLRVCKTA